MQNILEQLLPMLDLALCLVFPAQQRFDLPYKIHSLHEMLRLKPSFFPVFLPYKLVVYSINSTRMQIAIGCIKPFFGQKGLSSLRRVSAFSQNIINGHVNVSNFSCRADRLLTLP